MISAGRRALARAAVACLLTLVATAACADALGEATGKPLLEVTGKIRHVNGDRVARFDRAMIAAMATEELVTTTPWTDGVQRFEGFPLARLLQEVGAEGSEISASAVNDYAATMPLRDTVEAGAFIAYRLNGQPMPLRERGPLWIVFPYDSDDRLVGDAYLNRSVWQLKAIEIK